jgi:hypothetical protein
MAPLMVGAVMLSAAFFAAIMIWQFGLLQARIYQPAQEMASIAWTGPGRAPTNFQEQQQLVTLEAKYALEQESIARRYDLADLTFTTRLWTRLIGFLTGMILAMVGAAFILGKLETEQSDLAAQAQGLSFTIKSTSPGIIMAVLGTVLMSITIVISANVVTHDGAIYFTGSSGEAAPEFQAIESTSPDKESEAGHSKAPKSTSDHLGSIDGDPAEEPKLKSAVKKGDTQ